MVGIARKNLFHDKTRLLISIIGVAFAVVLILILEGFAAGIFKQAAVYSANSGAELFVVQENIEGMQSVRSIIPETLKGTLTKIDGVKHVVGIQAAPIMFEHRGRKTPIELIGFRPRDKMGGPWNLDSGRLPRRSDEVVLDLALAQRNKIKLGDKVEILGAEFKVIGLSRETTSWMNPYVFILRSRASRLLLAEGSVSFFLIHLKDSTNIKKARRQAAGLVKDYDVLTTEEISGNDTAIIEEVMASPMGVMVGISYIIGTLVIGLTVYTAVLNKLKEYGVIKAIGGANRRLYGIVLKQTFIITALGFAAGVIFSFAAAGFIEASFPQFLIEINQTVIYRNLFVALIMGFIASVVPIRKISRVDPMTVFKG